MKELNEIILRELNRKPRLKRAYGIVTEQLSAGKFKVRITRDHEEIKNIQYAIEHKVEIDATNDLTFINKTIEMEDDVLKPGDLVWIHYWNTISDGYIAIKIGYSNLVQRREERPYHRMAVITDAYFIVPYD